MKTWKSFLAFIAILSTGAVAAFGQGASPRRGTIVVPDSSLQRAADVGVRAHTNHLIFVPAGGKLVLSSPSGETPGSLACIYKLPTAASGLSSGCPTSDFLNISSSSGSGIIAIVDAYHYPSAPQDFVTFSNTFHLPTGNNCNGGKACFTQVSAAKGRIKTNSGWALEAALDIEWAHAMAPTAQIVLVEAASNSNSNLFDAVALASQIVACGSTDTTSCPGNGTGEVSMSWGGSEFSQETTYDTYFNAAGSGIVYTAASGDSGGVVIYPSASPYVLSAGGTTIHRNSSKNFSGETAWSSSGGGPSAYEAEPPYQQSYVSTVNLNGMRGTPDFSYDADPSSGVSVYDSTSYQGLTGWFTIGGTSVASPSLAGIINLAGSFAADTGSELTTIYQDYSSGFNPNTNSYSSDFRDITSGSTSGCSGGGGGNPHHKSTSSSSCYNAQPGWDFITGVGTNLGTAGK